MFQGSGAAVPPFGSGLCLATSQWPCSRPRGPCGATCASGSLRSMLLRSKVWMMYARSVCICVIRGHGEVSSFAFALSLRCQHLWLASLSCCLQGFPTKLCRECGQRGGPSTLACQCRVSCARVLSQGDSRTQPRSISKRRPTAGQVHGCHASFFHLRLPHCAARSLDQQLEDGNSSLQESGWPCCVHNAACDGSLAGPFKALVSFLGFPNRSRTEGNDP